jgi:hypothetical protein
MAAATNMTRACDKKPRMGNSDRLSVRAMATTIEKEIGCNYRQQ